MRAKEGGDPFSDSSLSLPHTLLLDKFIVLLTPEPNCVFTLGEGVYVCVCVCISEASVMPSVGSRVGRISSWKAGFADVGPKLLERGS